jgi:MoxR-like ATPase
MKTPAEEVGFVVGGQYRLQDEHNTFNFSAGTTLTFNEDDGSINPWFIQDDPNDRWPIELSYFFKTGQTKLTQEQIDMAWTEIEEFKPGDKVSTPHGDANVIQAYENNITYEVPGGWRYNEGRSRIKKIETQGEKQTEEKGERVEFTTEDIGKSVKKKKDGKLGKIVDVNSRNVRVEWQTGLKESINKKEAHNHIEKTEDQAKNEEKAVEQKTSNMADSMFALLEVERKVREKIDEKVDEGLKEIKEIAESKRTLEIKKGDETREVKGTKHKQLEQLIEYAAARLNPLLVGMAGTGKTHAAEQASDALGLRFFSISVGAQTTKTDIMGYMSANGDYISTHFRDAYENGGIFLMDEIDAGNANVLITINAALSNGIAAFPDTMVKKHDDFIFIASANTFGNGANRQYVGRNQLDAATLDRFAVIEWLIDDDLERSLARGEQGNAWYEAVKETRKYVADRSIRALISPRATQKGSLLISLGKSAEEAANATLLSSVPEDKKADILKIALDVFNRNLIPKGKAKPAQAPKKSSEGIAVQGNVIFGGGIGTLGSLPF